MVDFEKLAEMIVSDGTETEGSRSCRWCGHPSPEAVKERIIAFFNQYCFSVDISTDYYDAVALKIPLNIINGSAQATAIDFQSSPTCEIEKKKEPMEVSRFHDFLKNEK